MLATTMDSGILNGEYAPGRPQARRQDVVGKGPAAAPQEVREKKKGGGGDGIDNDDLIPPFLFLLL
jgi:hypothetical protein